MPDDPAAPTSWVESLKGTLRSAFNALSDPLEAVRQMMPGTKAVDQHFDRNYTNANPDAPKEARELVNAIGNLKVGPTSFSLKDVRAVADTAKAPKR
jgi:hypothetical protein